MKQSSHAKRMARQHKRSRTHTKLNLVSLMDIFTILVFFLLVNSSEVDVVQSNKDITLPTSVAEQKPKNNLVVMVSDKDILVGGRKVANTPDVLKSQESEIAALRKELDYLASRKPFRSEKAKEKGREVTIMGDEAIPYTLLKKIMATCAKSDYRNISLAVNQVPDNSVPEGAKQLGGNG